MPEHSIVTYAKTLSLSNGQARFLDLLDQKIGCQLRIVVGSQKEPLHSAYLAELVAACQEAYHIAERRLGERAAGLQERDRNPLDTAAAIARAEFERGPRQPVNTVSAPRVLHHTPDPQNSRFD